jgi:plasmid segregation protein ParM
MSSTSSAEETIQLTGGIDVGNGYVKGVIRGEVGGEEVFDTIDLPSAVVSTSRSTPKVPEADSDAVRIAVEDDFYNHLAASFTTPLIGHSDLRTFGRAALSTPGSKFTQFEVVGARSKADQELSSVLVLGVFAAKALRDHVRRHGSLPSHELRAIVRAGLALPIAEYVQRRSAYAAQFVGRLGRAEPTVHLVTIKNFSTPVTVRLQFEDVQVLPEGASAQFAIADKGAPLSQALLDDLRASDPAEAASLEGVTAELLVGVRNTVGVDVGEGTVNFPVFTDGAFNSEAASTLEQGYGTALTNALDRMSTSGDRDLRFKNRKALADFLQQEPSVFLQGRFDRAKGYVDEEAEYLAEEIGARFEDVLAEVGGTTEVIYVYGGGSGPIKEILRPVLQKAAGGIPVLYLDAAYSRHLNREGLYLAARAVEAHIPASGRSGVTA